MYLEDDRNCVMVSKLIFKAFLPIKVKSYDIMVDFIRAMLSSFECIQNFDCSAFTSLPVFRYLQAVTESSSKIIMKVLPRSSFVYPVLHSSMTKSGFI